MDITDAESKAQQEIQQTKDLRASIEAAKVLSNQQEFNRKHQIFVQKVSLLKQEVENVLAATQIRGLIIEDPTEDCDSNVLVRRKMIAY